MSSLKATGEKEIQTARDEWLKEAIHHQDMRVTVEEHEEHIYEEPPEVRGKVLSFLLLAVQYTSVVKELAKYLVGDS